MHHGVKYVLLTIAGVGVVALGSLVWPKFTKKPEPHVLEQVRDVVLGTDIGEKTAQLLGATDGGGHPLNLSDAVSSVAGVVTTSVEQKVQQIVSDQVASQIVKQYQQLPALQQDRVVEMICKPKE